MEYNEWGEWGQNDSDWGNGWATNNTTTQNYNRQQAPKVCINERPQPPFLFYFIQAYYIVNFRNKRTAVKVSKIIK